MMRKYYPSLLLLTFLWACQKDAVPTTPVPPAPVTTTYDTGTGSSHLILGNPSAADDNPANTTNYLLVKNQYVTSYNSSRGIPNWTAWHLAKQDLGTTARQDDFRPDATLPTGFYQVKPTDYTSADGFDRGHMCPSADRTSSVVNNSSTFLMTNIDPQAPDLNRGLWEELEAFCREQAYNGNEVYIYSGGYGSGGTGSMGYVTTMASGRITVPARYFKIMLILPQGDNDISRITEQTTVLAVDVPNMQITADKGWDDYITTVATIEQSTKLTFWSNLPAGVRGTLRLKKYSVPVTTPTIPVSGTTTTPPSATITSPPVSGTTSPPSTTTPTSGCGYYKGKVLHKGPEGGCYYINSNGNKTYVDRSYCNC